MNARQILILVLIFNGCCKESRLLENGLTKNANRVTEISIKVKYDSLENRFLDTTSITEKFYNKENQILKRIENPLVDGEITEIEYVYDKSKLLQKEIVKMSLDTATVHYYYNDTLLSKTKSRIINSEFEFFQVTDHKYTEKNMVSEVSTSQIIIELESGDTTLNSLEVDRYNEKGQLKESQTTNFVNPGRSMKYLYKYNCGRLVESKEYNLKDSLISITTLEYILDEFDNWIERKSIKNSRLSYINRRKIEYK